ncbi:MAG: hypothetical protein MSG64_15380 [Pyrinomonadaceae bacterium MAG19_C2-C3]|nr:hypothetical protein [Pyrinomonadaceae bacterium MAG19_C2-C3]
MNYNLMPRLRELGEHNFEHALDTNFVGLADNILLPLVDPLYEVFLTRDRKLRYQQNLSKFSLALIVLKSSNILEDLLTMLPDIRDALAVIRPQEVREIIPK